MDKPNKRSSSVKQSVLGMDDHTDFSVKIFPTGLTFCFSSLKSTPHEHNPAQLQPLIHRRPTSADSASLRAHDGFDADLTRIQAREVRIRRPSEREYQTPVGGEPSGVFCCLASGGTICKSPPAKFEASLSPHSGSGSDCRSGALTLTIARRVSGGREVFEA